MVTEREDILQQHLLSDLFPFSGFGREMAQLLRGPVQLENWRHWAGHVELKEDLYSRQPG
jgi:hypothetical protein